MTAPLAHIFKSGSLRTLCFGSFDYQDWIPRKDLRYQTRPTSDESEMCRLCQAAAQGILRPKVRVG